MPSTKELHNVLSDPADALQRIDAVLRLSRSAVWEVDRDGVFTYVSASFEDLLGYRPEELVGQRTIRDFYPRELPPGLETELSEDWIGEGEEFSQLAVPLVAKSGEIVWVSSSGMPVRDAEGRVTGFRGVDRDITALKRDEEQLRNSEQDLWRQIQKAPVPMAFTTATTPDELHVNEAFVRAFGYQPEEVAKIEDWLSKGYPDPAYRDKVRHDSKEWLAQAMRGETPASREYRITCSDGRILDVEVGAASVAGRFIGTFTDVTMRRRELELRKSREEDLQKVLDHLPFPVATSVASPDFDWRDARAQVTYLNRCFTDLLGYTLADIPTIGDWARLAYPDEETRTRVFTALERQVQAALAGEGDIGPVGSRVRTKNGEDRDVVIKAVAVGSRLVISLQDETERNRAVQELENKEKLLRSLVEYAPVPISSAAPDGSGIYLNRAFTEAYGWTTEDVPTFELWFEKAYPDEAYRREVLARWGTMLERAWKTDGRVPPTEYRVTAKDGSVHDVEVSAVVYGNALFGAFIDLTERNRAERLLRERQEQLSRVGRVSALGQLAASLAHELDQPLGAILNNAEAARLLLSREVPDLTELRNIVEDVLSDNRRAGAVLDRIRGMVRQRRFEPQAVPVEPLLQEVVRLIRPLATPHKIALEISCEPGLPDIDGDPVLLQQALLNLGLNATEAIGDRAHGRIEIRAGEAKHGMVEIAHIDNGGGVPVSEVASLFEPFHTTKRDGLGMGLPLVQSIVEQHGGRLRIDNQPGRGLTVILQLPARRP